MITVLVISAFFLGLAAAANAVMDTLAHHYSGSIFAKRNPLFWNPVESWRNKYKNGDPAKGAKFWLSTTLLVFLTDGWHLAKFVMTNSYLMAFSLPAWFLIHSQWWGLPLIFFGTKTIQGIIFNALYHKTFITNPPT